MGQLCIGVELASDDDAQGRNPLSLVEQAAQFLLKDHAAQGLQRVAWDLRGEAPEVEQESGRGGFGGFGGRNRRGPPVEPGRYVATLGWKVGEDVVEVGPTRSFHVVGVDW